MFLLLPCGWWDEELARGNVLRKEGEKGVRVLIVYEEEKEMRIPPFLSLFFLPLFFLFPVVGVKEQLHLVLTEHPTLCNHIVTLSHDVLILYVAWISEKYESSLSGLSFRLTSVS